MLTYIIIYWPSSNNPNAESITQHLAGVIAANALWLKLSFSTWAVKSNAPPTNIYNVLAQIVPSSDFLMVAEASGGFENNQGNALPWNQPASAATASWVADVPVSSEPNPRLAATFFSK